MYECNSNAARRHCQRVDARTGPWLEFADGGRPARLRVLKPRCAELSAWIDVRHRDVGNVPLGTFEARESAPFQRCKPDRECKPAHQIG
jgi:hypothetical protein